LGQIIAPEPVTANLLQLPLPPFPPELLAAAGGASPGGSSPAAPSPTPGTASGSSGSPGPAPGTELQGPAPGTGSDIWRATLSDPILGGAITELGHQAAARAKSDWHSLSTGGEVALVTTSVAIVGGALVGVLSHPDARDWFAREIGGKVIPVPGVTGLGAQFNLGGSEVIVGLHLDLGALLPTSLGFGPGGSTRALGEPPNPYAAPAGQRAPVPGAPSGPTGTGTEDLANQLSASAGQGSSLPQDVRGALQSQLGADLSQVRVHTDGGADRLARSVDAVAFTVGRDMYFSRGAYQPDSEVGRQLITHEAVHTLQQATGPVAGTDVGGISISNPSDPFEQEAARIAESAPAHGTSAAIGATEPATPTLARDVPDQSAAGQASAALGAPLSAESLQASATIAANQVIATTPDKVVHTTDATQIHIIVSNNRLEIDFSPQLVITADSGHWWVPNPDIYLTQTWFDFSAGTYGEEMSAPNYALWFGDAANKTLTGIYDALFAKMPARMRAGGYDPFTDAQLPADLQAMASSLSGGSGGGGLHIDNSEFTASVTLAAELREDLGGAIISVPAGTRLSLSISPQGDLPMSAADFANLKLSSIQASSSRDEASVNLRVFDSDLPIAWVSTATLVYGGHLQLNYVLINEALSAAFSELVRAGVIPGTLDDATRDPNSPAAHALVDAQVAKHLEPLVKDAILSKRDLIPGLDLAQALGVTQ